MLLNAMTPLLLVFLVIRNVPMTSEHEKGLDRVPRRTVSKSAASSTENVEFEKGQFSEICKWNLKDQ